MEEKEASVLEENKETLQNEQQKFQELSTEYVQFVYISVNVSRRAGDGVLYNGSWIGAPVLHLHVRGR